MKLKKRMKMLKISKYIGLGLMAAGFLTVLGAAGSLDYANFSIYTILMTAAVGVCVCAIGLLTAHHCDSQLNEIISELILYKAGRVEITDEKQHNIA